MEDVLVKVLVGSGIIQFILDIGAIYWNADTEKNPELWSKTPAGFWQFNPYIPLAGLILSRTALICYYIHCAAYCLLLGFLSSWWWLLLYPVQLVGVNRLHKRHCFDNLSIVLPIFELSLLTFIIKLGI